MPDSLPRWGHMGGSGEPDPRTSAPSGLGLVGWQDFTSAEPFTFECGQTLTGLTLRYETYGHLNAARDNAIFIAHALSGDHHAAGIHGSGDGRPGWWDNMIGPGKAVDTRRYFVVCSNCLAGCKGSTGPSSIDPATGRPWGMRFPPTSIRDMAAADTRLLDHLGIRSLHAAIGGSMGGMRVLQMAVDHPGMVRRMIPMATTARESAQALAFNAVGRQAILRDPDWADGEYPASGGPRVGLAVARMMAHITYLSDAAMDQKFGRRRPATDDAGLGPFDMQWEVERYLRYQGNAFVDRFDARSYLYITRAIDEFDLAGEHGSLERALAPVRARSLCIGFASDWLFPPAQNREIALALLRAGKSASYAELPTDRGHDSFLLDSPQLYGFIGDFLEAPSR